MPATERLIHRLLLLGILGLGAAGLLFYQIQNQAALPGGDVAAVKVAWLGTVLFCWYWFPLVLLLDRRLGTARRLVALFLGNMLARAVAELTMMYLWHNWHPFLGMAHDLFSALFALYLASRVQGSSHVRQYLRVMALLFLVETGFAAYMYLQVQGEGPVYYVPADGAHTPILALTGLAVASTWIWLMHHLHRRPFRRP